mmetsp:Transcript_118502/g.347136  ORF Transcript_118502/g.347136 Transcript_118502/m.347136 type:complete len:254 (-) Transcript_118502:350-1111(-)
MELTHLQQPLHWLPWLRVTRRATTTPNWRGRGMSSRRSGRAHSKRGPWSQNRQVSLMMVRWRTRATRCTFLPQTARSTASASITWSRILTPTVSQFGCSLVGRDGCIPIPTGAGTSAAARSRSATSSAARASSTAASRTMGQHQTWSRPGRGSAGTRRPSSGARTRPSSSPPTSRRSQRRAGTAAGRSSSGPASGAAARAHAAARGAVAARPSPHGLRAVHLPAPSLSRGRRSRGLERGRRSHRGLQRRERQA